MPGPMHGCMHAPMHRCIHILVKRTATPCVDMYEEKKQNMEEEKEGGDVERGRGLRRRNCDAETV